MKFKSSFLVLAAAALTGCASLVSPVAQGIFNTAAEGVTEGILAKDPAQLPALQGIAAALPNAFAGSITSQGIGQIVGQVGHTAGASDSTILVLAANLDGAFRNYVRQQGGSAAQGTVPSLQGAIAQQVLAVYADGMTHGIALYQGATSAVSIGGQPVTTTPLK